MSSEPIALLLRAENPVRNVRRSYDIAVDRDLFGFWCVSLAWGRIGRPGRAKFHTFDGPDDALAFARQQLRRRLKSKTRIGVDYEVISGDKGAFQPR